MEQGVVGIFGPGTLTEDIIRDVRQSVVDTPPP
jgi:methylmalonyl-CoA mutase cobalamin-binding subunit